MSSGELRGRTAIVTGGSRGLGLAIAQALGTAGASVLICARDADGVAEGVDALRAAGIDAAGEQADVGSPDDADRVVAAAVSRFGSVQVLVNNAGVYGPKGPAETVSWDEWVRAIEINLYGSVLMARAVIPHLRAAGHGKIVQLSGGGATAPLPNLSAYAASKAAVVRFAETLAEEVKADGIDVNCVAPGSLNTRLLDEVIAAGPELVGEAFYARALEQQANGGTPLERASSLVTFLASPASDGISGRLISAVWDPWETLAANRDALAGTDVFTLRRIVAEDRGLEWS